MPDLSNFKSLRYIYYKFSLLWWFFKGTVTSLYSPSPNFQIVNIVKTWNLVLGNFWSRWLRIRAHNSEIQNSGSNMVNENKEKLLNWNDIWYSGVFGVADYESELKIQKFEMADPVCKKHTDPKCKKLLVWGEIGYSGVFEIVDYESELNIQKIKMADPICLTKLYPEIFWFDALLSRKRFMKFWNILLYKKLKPKSRTMFPSKKELNKICEEAIWKSRFTCFFPY